MRLPWPVMRSACESHACGMQLIAIRPRESKLQFRMYGHSKRESAGRGARAMSGDGVKLLFDMITPLNTIRVVEVPPDTSDVQSANPFASCRLLLVGNERPVVYSASKQGKIVIDDKFYWHNLAIVAEAAPEGPIGVFGLGSGTVASILHHFWPERIIHGWELDPVILDIGRQYMGMQELETAGVLASYCGDALSEEASVPGGFSGLIVDIFSGNSVPDVLKEVAPWKSILGKLRPNGVLIANLGSAQDALSSVKEAFQEMNHSIYIGHTTSGNLLVANFDPQTLAQLPTELQGTIKNWKSANKEQLQ